MINARIYFLLLLFYCSSTFFAQTYKDSASCKTEIIYFKKSFYLFSYKENTNDLVLRVDRLSDSLKKTTNFEISLGKKKCTDFYSPQIDTLHGYINISIQQLNDAKTSRVIRLSPNLSLKADLPNSDITRINTFTAFEKEYYYFKNKLYVVRPLSKDSANKFVLQQYTLKDPAKLFEYNTGWQLNFAKQKYHRCHIFKVDDDFIYIFANIIEGTKKGQWVLFINPASGEIMQSERLNDENEDSNFLYGNCAYNKEAKELLVVGYKVPTKSMSTDYNKLDFTIGKTKSFPVFMCVFDSAGFLIERKDNIIPVPIDIEREKEFKQYICKVVKIDYSNNQYSFLSEIIAAPANTKLFKTYGYCFTQLAYDENNILKPKASVFTCTYRDSKNKEAKNCWNQHVYEGKGDADELLYSKPLSPQFIGHNWNLLVSPEKISIYSSFVTKSKKQLSFKYTFENNKWIPTEILNIPAQPYFKAFLTTLDKIYLFTAPKMDETLKYNLGITGEIK